MRWMSFALGLGTATLSGFAPHQAVAQDVSVTPVFLTSPHLERRFGAQEIGSISSLSSIYKGRENGSVDFLSLGDQISDSLVMPTESFRPTPIKIGPPLIQTKGIVLGDEALFISDTGKDSNHNEPATIWKLLPDSGDLSIFYRGPLLENSKWLFYKRYDDGRRDELIVADYGEEPVPRSPGTGVGAKVFAIEVNEDGTPGATRVLHEGAPFRSPEGVTVIGNTVIVSDWAAGEPYARPEAPEEEFLSGALFALPIEGGEPERLFPDHRFITLIGACIFPLNDKFYLRLIDIDGGRWDNSDLGYLPQSGLPGFS